MNSAQTTSTCFSNDLTVLDAEESPSPSLAKQCFHSVRNMPVWLPTVRSTTRDEATTSDGFSTATHEWRSRSFGKLYLEVSAPSKLLESRSQRDRTSTSELPSVSLTKTLTISSAPGSYATFWLTAGSTLRNASCKDSCID